jgi:hypothetical protein
MVTPSAAIARFFSRSGLDQFFIKRKEILTVMVMPNDAGKSQHHGLRD